jgi:hypothetical protein
VFAQVRQLHAELGLTILPVLWLIGFIVLLLHNLTLACYLMSICVAGRDRALQQVPRGLPHHFGPVGAPTTLPPDVAHLPTLMAAVSAGCFGYGRFQCCPCSVLWLQCFQSLPSTSQEPLSAAALQSDRRLHQFTRIHYMLIVCAEHLHPVCVLQPAGGHGRA